ncbi:unnamed protein product, partial [Phaeothamnion confervicola]
PESRNLKSCGRIFVRIKMKASSVPALGIFLAGACHAFILVPGMPMVAKSTARASPHSSPYHVCMMAAKPSRKKRAKRKETEERGNVAEDASATGFDMDLVTEKGKDGVELDPELTQLFTDDWSGMASPKGMKGGEKQPLPDIGKRLRSGGKADTTVEKSIDPNKPVKGARAKKQQPAKSAAEMYEEGSLIKASFPPSSLPIRQNATLDINRGRSFPEIRVFIHAFLPLTNYHCHKHTLGAISALPMSFQKHINLRHSSPCVPPSVR